MSDWYAYDITPVPKPRQTRADVWKKRPAVMRYRAFADELRMKVKNVPVPFHVHFVIPIPKSKKIHPGCPHRIRPDIDNLLKAVMDALWDDGDEWISDVRASKAWGERGAIWFRKLEYY